VLCDFLWQQCRTQYKLCMQGDNTEAGPSTSADGRPSVEERDAEETLQGSEEALRMLAKLQALPWCRMDCSFQGTKFPYFAHNLVQVSSPTLPTTSAALGSRQNRVGNGRIWAECRQNPGRMPS